MDKNNKIFKHYNIRNPLKYLIFFPLKKIINILSIYLHL